MWGSVVLRCVNLDMEMRCHWIALSRTLVSIVGLSVLVLFLVGMREKSVGEPDIPVEPQIQSMTSIEPPPGKDHDNPSHHPYGMGSKSMEHQSDPALSLDPSWPDYWR